MDRGRTIVALLALAGAIGCGTEPECECPTPPDEITAGGEAPVAADREEAVVEELEPDGTDAGVAPAAAALRTTGPARMRVHHIDVGQGDASLLEFSCGAVLIDTGGEDPNQYPGTQRLTAYLDAFFERRQDLNGTLDLLLITHPHIDHTRGVRAVMERYTVRNVVTNGGEGSSGGAQQRYLHQQVQQRPDLNGRTVSLDDVPNGGGLTDDIIDPVACEDLDPEIRILWGALSQEPNWPSGEFDDMNNHSLVVRLDFGEFSALFTGDLEEHAIGDLIARASTLLDVDIYQAGHHGSINGTTAELVEAMTPEAAIISMGAPEREGRFSASSFGHPRREIVQMLEESISRRRSEPVNVLLGLPAPDRRAARQLRRVHRAPRDLRDGMGWEHHRHGAVGWEVLGLAGATLGHGPPWADGAAIATGSGLAALMAIWPHVPRS